MPSARREAGFTVVELMFTMALVAILLTLAVFAIRQFWFNRALVAGQDEITVQLRTLQQAAVSEGISGRYHGAWFDPGSELWGSVVYESGTCRSTGTYELSSGVLVESVTVGTTAADVDFQSPTDVAAACQTQLASVSDDVDVKFVWFLSRGVGTETSGDHIHITQTRLDRSEEIQVRVIGLTGRVEPVTVVPTPGEDD